MGYRQVIIRQSERLKTKDNGIVVVKDGNETIIPLEDINFILLEDNTTVITSKLLSEFGKYSICFIVCDDKHEPISIMYPYNYHFKQLEVIHKQLSLTDENKDLLWQLIVKQKIQNQIATLERTTKDERVINILYQYISEVEPGDPTNREGLSAKLYFKSLFGSDFMRFYDDAINAALNYGYAIIKSAIIRTLVVFGLNTYMGINHQSKVNNFNLVYDLIEPYRAIVDKFVYDHMKELTYPLSFEFRTNLVNILNQTVICQGKHYTIDYSIEMLVKSYIKAIDTGEIALTLPSQYYV